MQLFLISVDDPQLLKADLHVMKLKIQLLPRIHKPRYGNNLMYLKLIQLVSVAFVFICSSWTQKLI